MSDRVPKVKIEPEGGRYVAVCHEPDCGWRQAPDAISYVMERARAHRAEHRARAARDAEAEAAETSSCDHSESLYGRCVACGMTWEQQEASRG